MPVPLKEKPSYRAIHSWIERQLGKPHRCDECGDDSLEHRQYHWANISGEYRRDISDWKRLCVRCHRKMDFGAEFATECSDQHFKEVYVKPDGRRECRNCKRLYRKYYREKYKK